MFFQVYQRWPGFVMGGEKRKRSVERRSDQANEAEKATCRLPPNNATEASLLRGSLLDKIFYTS